MVNDRFKFILIPDDTIVVDESMIPWRGCLIFQHYNPQKAHRYRVKLYKLSSTNDYTVKINVYAGKNDVTGEKEHAQKVVLHLLGVLLEKGRILYADNFYTNVPLAEFLLLKKLISSEL